MAALGFRSRRPHLTLHRSTLQAIKLSLKQTHTGGVCESLSVREVALLLLLPGSDFQSDLRSLTALQKACLDIFVLTNAAA